ncbi:MAG: tetratricopeptide repeat protein [Candidatus Paceibacterota bacterium]|jgi:tetratricopeptide (TPR) repeat protein
MEGETRVKSFWSFDRLALFVLTAGFLILPIFTLPLWATSLEISKHLLLVLTVFVAFTFWLLGRLQAGKLVLPKNLIVAGAFIVSLITLLSAASSGSFWNSFSGLGYELDTFLTIFSLSLLLFLFGIYFQSRKRFLTAYIGVFVVAIIFFVLELLAVIVLRTSALSLLKPFFLLPFNNLLTSLIGKWYDFGVYSGFILLSSLIMLEFFSLKRMPIFKGFIATCFILSLICLVLVNYLPIWIVLGIAALILFVYKISFWEANSDKEEGEKKQVSKVFHPSFVVILIALLFITLGGSDKLGQNISRWRDGWGVSVFEVKPSWQGTWNVVEKSLVGKTLLGAGPNRFVNEWIKFKPAAVNNTLFWNIDFRYGVGLLPSLLVTTGLLGLLAWLFFFGAILWYGLRFIFTTKQDRSTRALLLLSFLGSVYLWLFTIIYVPDTALLALAFMVTGLFVAILTDTQIIKYGEISLIENPRHSFVATLVFVVLIIGTIAVGYLSLQKYVSVYLFQRGLTVLNQPGDLDKGRMLISQAASLSDQDTYYRTLSEIDLVQINRLLADSKLTKEELRVRFLAQTDSAIKNAIKATTLDSQNYLNWLALGRVYEALVPLGVDKAYEQGQLAFNRAKQLKPTDPSILLDYFARLEISNKNLAKARDYVKDSLAVKNDYAPAISLLSQLDAQEGNLDVAARRLEEFLGIYPQYNDANLYFQLGWLKYQRENYRGAISALEQAVTIVPNFSNAKYFLGLSYDRIGDKALALKQFQEIAKLNPGNKEVEQIISNLLSGQGSLAPVSAVTSTSTKMATTTPRVK